DAQLNRLGLRHRKGAPETFDAAGYAHALHRVRAGEPDVYVPGFERDVEQPVAAALVIPAAARLVVTEGNYLLLGAERWAAARAEMDQVWFVTGDEDVRLRRLVARHVQFGKGEIQAREWVAVNDEPNAVLVHHTMPSADLVVENSADGWLLVR
ncbi:MAG: nucleoside/nucleotide kinase family protein, partial [Micrococcales bacterium]